MKLFHFPALLGALLLHSSLGAHTPEAYFPPAERAMTVWVGDTNHVEAPPENWFNLDPTRDQVRGISTELAYQELLKGRTSRTVVVAVIDSGIDIEHEDLKDNIWVNADEIVGNGLDDDNNGYVDDIHGWNFIGGKDGKNVIHDSFEITREYARLQEKFEDVDIMSLKRKELREFAYFYELEKDYEEKYEEYQQQYYEIRQFYQLYNQAYELMEEALEGAPVNLENVQNFETEDPQMTYVKNILSYALENGITSEALESDVEELENRLKYGMDPEFNPRDIVGDNYSDLDEKGYGNNDVEGPDAMHGTHVAGIIAANRTNELGMKGIADNVRIMVLRAVPDGDERDKDIANAIMYAVDNGAHIINMSFGKDYSPQKARVDEAVKYAEKNDVLLVHAAGNDGENIDEENNFPTAAYKKAHGKKRAKNWIEVGASSWKEDEGFVASFSNYGDEFVHIFAPGVDMYSTVPDQEYKDSQGTSMAAPVVSGVAALLRSYFPDLSAEEVKDIILASARKFPGRVSKPGGEEGETVNFASLSVTGGVVNAYEAVNLALQRSN